MCLDILVLGKYIIKNNRNKIQNFNNNLIDHKETIFKALKKLDKSEIKILFVRNNKKIIGSITDGDLRRII